MKKHLPIIALIISALLMCGCSGHGIKDIKVTSVKIVSVSPRGLNGLDALLELGIHNPAMSFEVTDVTGVAKMDGQECLVVTADQLIVSGKTDKVYSVPLKGSLSEGFNPFQLLNIVGGSMDMSKITVSVKAKVALRGGIGKNIELKDIPLSSLISKE